MVDGRLIDEAESSPEGEVENEACRGGEGSGGCRGRRRWQIGIGFLFDMI